MSDEGLPATGPFELSGDALCLDFTNTWADRGRAESDRLRSFGSLLAFARQTGIVRPRQAAAVARRAAAEPAEAQRELLAALHLREALYRLLVASARRQRSNAGDLEVLNHALAQTLPHLRLERQGDRLAWACADDAQPSPGTALRAIARSAAELLTSGDLERIRECDGPRCTWLFLDRSRNRSRRWCSMQSCGNRAKAQRHYHRHRLGG